MPIANQVAASTNGQPQGFVPLVCNHVTVSIDAQQKLLFVFIGAWESSGRGKTTSWCPSSTTARIPTRGGFTSPPRTRPARCPRPPRGGTGPRRSDLRPVRTAAERAARPAPEGGWPPQHFRGPPDAVDERTVENFVRWLRGQKRTRNGARRGKRDVYRVGSIKFILSTCRTAYHWAARRRMLPPYTENPFSRFLIDSLRDPGEEDEGQRVFTPEQEQGPKTGVQFSHPTTRDRITGI